jgi:hypothetical protein
MVAGIEEMVADKGYHSGAVMERVNLQFRFRRATGELDTLRLQHGCQLVIGERALGIFVVDELAYLALQGL